MNQNDECLTAGNVVWYCTVCPFDSCCSLMELEAPKNCLCTPMIQGCRDFRYSMFLDYLLLALSLVQYMSLVLVSIGR